ncbi:MAG TPA: hypothetical protein VFY32_01005, partial [Solirubrobacteraceae bacterium]|nr:hypothetical protein [Solirubrobacteraceae bacterium]
GIPVTTPSRTLLDLAATLPHRALERALDEAEIRELYDLSSLDALASAHQGERGTAAIARCGSPTASSHASRRWWPTPSPK